MHALSFASHIFLRNYVDSFVVDTIFVYIFVILHCLSCSTMWSSAHRGQRFPDWSEAFALWLTLCGALPVRWRFPPAPRSHHQVPRQRQMGPAQDHLYEVWVPQLYSLNVNLKNQMARFILFSLYPQQGDLTATDATTIRPTTSAESTRGTVQEVIEVNRRVTAISNQIIPSCPPAFHLNLLIFDIRRPFTFPPSRLAQSSPIMIRGALLDLTRTITISLFHLFIC